MNKPLDLAVLREHAFALVDAAMMEQLPQWLIAQVLVPTRLAQSAHLMPSLIDLAHLPGDRLDALLACINSACESDKPPPIALLIQTDSSATEIARHWNAMQLPERGLIRKSWLRLHDPRVLHQMLHILQPMQRRQLFGTARALTYSISNEWVREYRDTNSPSVDQIVQNGVAPYAGPARWDWVRIERIGLVNRALHAAGIQQAAVLRSRGALAEKLIERAIARHGIVDRADLVEFAVRGLKAHEQFDQHPDVARALKTNPVSTDSSLSDRFALIDEHVWNELCQA